MKLKEVHAIEQLIKDRRESLSREDLSEFELDKRARALMVLINARDELVKIGDLKEPSVPFIKTRSPYEPRKLVRQFR